MKTLRIFAAPRKSSIHVHLKCAQPTVLLPLNGVAVMASLQIAFDSITGRLGQVPVDEATVSRVAALRMKCDEALDPALEG